MKRFYNLGAFNFFRMANEEIQSEVIDTLMYDISGIVNTEPVHEISNNWAF